MVSGLVTSPCDQLRIFSGEASEGRIASKSGMGLLSSNGLERYKTTLLGTSPGMDCSKARAGYIPGIHSAQPSCPSREHLRLGTGGNLPKYAAQEGEHRLDEPGRSPIHGLSLLLQPSVQAASFLPA